MDRREFLATLCYGGIATFGAPLVQFAKTREGGRLVFVLLRGGMDGLAAVVPHGDQAYRALRGTLAFESSALFPLADGFGLAPGLAPLAPFWARGEMAVLNAMAIPVRTRSHFDGQAILETGLDRADGAADGWLNRLLQVMPGERSGIAIAAGMPRSLVGPHEVQTWSPARLGVVDDAYLDRLALLYRTDPALHGRFEAALQQGEVAGEVGMEERARGGRRDRGGGVAPLLRAAARILRQPDGPNVAAMELSGWDTHAGQGAAGGALDRLLGRLAEGLAAFRDEMGAAWPGTTVVVMTEFGRTARPNGTGGTDHGTAGVGFVLGTHVARSALWGDWPGLSDRALYEGRDLAPALDTRAVLKGVVEATFDLTRAQVNRVFPGSDAVRGLQGMMR